MRKIRILHVVQNLNYGGMERLIGDIAREVDPAEFDSHILVLQYLGRFAEGLRAHATLHQAPPLGRLSMLRPHTLAAVIHQIAPDVVHTHSGVWYKASAAARLAGVTRIIHTEHGRRHPDPWFDRLVDSRAARRTSAVVAVSELLARHMARTIVPRTTRLHVIPNGVDTRRFFPEADDGVLRRELGLALEPIKGFDVAVQAFATLREHWDGAGPAPVMVIAGDGSERARLEAKSRSLGLADGIHFLGWRDDVHTLHAGFTIFTMSSHSEGTSVSLLEAMSAGLCPVVTNVGGNAAVLGAQLSHRLVPGASPDGLAAAWHDVLVMPETATIEGALARRRVQEAFDLRRMIAAYEALYRGSDQRAESPSSAGTAKI